KKERMQNVLDVLDNEGVNSSPKLQVELAFREFFNIRLNINEIQFLLRMESPLKSFNNYKFGLRHIEFDEYNSALKLNKKRGFLNFIMVISIIGLLGSSLGIVVMLLFTAAAVLSPVSADII